MVDPVDAAKKLANVVFHPISPIHELFDFLYQDSSGHFHVFQATIGKAHTANATKIRELEDKLGSPWSLSFYYLVPSSMFDKFVTTPTDPRRATEKVKMPPLCNIYHVSIPNPADEQRSD